MTVVSGHYVLLTPEIMPLVASKAPMLEQVYKEDQVLFKGTVHSWLLFSPKVLSRAL